MSEWKEQHTPEEQPEEGGHEIPMEPIARNVFFTGGQGDFGIIEKNDFRDHSTRAQALGK